MNRFLRFFYRLPVCLLVLSLCVGAGHSNSESKHNRETLDRLAAIVNQESITERELAQQMRMFAMHFEETGTPIPPLSALREQTLEHMILERIQLQLAKQHEIQIEEQEVQETINNLAARNQLTVEEFERALGEKNISLSQFREKLKHDLTILRLQQQEVSPHINVTPQEIDSFLNSPKSNISSYAYQVGYVLFEIPEQSSQETVKAIEQKAKEMMPKIKKANQSYFESNTDGQQANVKIGLLDWRSLSELPSAFSNEVSQLPIHATKGPIRAESGFYLIKLLDKKDSTAPTITEMHVRHILLKLHSDKTDNELEEKLQSLRQKILRGNSFAEMARLHSEEPKSASKGGDLGWINEKMVLPEFYQQMQSLKTKEISAPFKTELGWHLIQLLGKRTAKESPALQRQQAMEALRQKKFEIALKDWLKRIREDAQVIIYPVRNISLDSEN